MSTRLQVGRVHVLECGMCHSAGGLVAEIMVCVVHAKEAGGSVLFTLKGRGGSRQWQLSEVASIHGWTAPFSRTPAVLAEDLSTRNRRWGLERSSWTVLMPRLFTRRGV